MLLFMIFPLIRTSVISGEKLHRNCVNIDTYSVMALIFFILYHI